MHLTYPFSSVTFIIMSEYLIDGGVPLDGTVRASGNKNAALPCIAAAL
jgi:UDP-N-acetylglucosamine 1-carboxyvinyltransferase